MYCLKGKLDDNSRFGSVLVKISNPLIQTNLIRNTFKFKKIVITKLAATELRKNVMHSRLYWTWTKGYVRGMAVHNQRPTLGSKKS